MENQQEQRKRWAEIKLDYLPCINYAMVHNKVDFVSACELVNLEDTDWHDVRVTLTSPLLKPCEMLFSRVGARERMPLSDMRLEPDVAQLMDLTEAVTTSFTLQVVVEDVVKLEEEHPVTILAFDEWSGAGVMPELLASFVVPNQSLISTVVTRAAEFMKKFTGSSEMDEYQTQDPNRVRAQVAAIYEALRSEALVYAAPPASFEQTGQRIRLADKVLNEKIGTCIDLSLLVASCLEAVGIFPLIVLMRGHAFVGAWLKEDMMYSQNISDDASYLLKMAADGVNQVVLLEATSLTASSPVTFDQAADRALNTLKTKAEEFDCFIDIRHCRLSGIRPLPQRIRQDDGQWTVVNEGVEHDNATEKIKYLDHFSILLNAGSANRTRQTIWERKLLDFSLRNTLINTRLGKRVVPFISFHIDSLEDAMQDGKQFRIMPCPDTKVMPTEAGMYDSQAQVPQLEELVSQEMTAKRIVSYLTDTELKSALKFIHKASRNSLEESGANSLFLALGLLKWYESDKSVQQRFAPILLLPVNIKRYSASDYAIESRDEDMILNVTMVELLKQQFDIDLGNALAPLPLDEHGVDVKRIFALIRQVISKEKRWDVVEEALLGMFSFSKFVMWNDIHSNAGKLKENPVVNGLINQNLRREQPQEGSQEAQPTTRELDLAAAPDAFAMPVDVDSSQMEAVIDSGKGQSFILYGPPGTGKSQTITNMIANALYQGKRVLFVAEKMAALSVVQRRLEKVGLAPFCLELHSNKVTKSHFLEQMERALNVTHIQPPQQFAETSRKLFELRKQLIGNMERLHRKRHYGLSLYDAISYYLSIPQKEVEEGLPDSEMVTADNIQRWKELVRPLERVAQVTGHPASHPLKGLAPFASDAEHRQQLKSLLSELHQVMREMILSTDRRVFGASRFFGADFSATDLCERQAICQTLSQTDVFNRKLYDITNYEQKMDDVRQLVENGQQRDQLRQTLTADHDESVLRLNGKQLQAEWEEIREKFFITRFFAKRSFMKRMKAYKRDMKFDDVSKLAQQLKQYGAYTKNISDIGMNLEDAFGDAGRAGREKWNVVAASLDHAKQLHQRLSAFARSHQQPYADVVSDFFSITTEQFSCFKAEKGDDLRQYGDLYKRYSQLVMSICQLADMDIPDEHIATDGIQAVERWISHYDDGYDDWCQWTTRRKRLCEEGLEAAVARLESDAATTPADAFNATLKGALHQVVMKIVQSDENLRMFNGLIFEDIITHYRQLAADFQTLTKKELYCRLAANIPIQTMDAGSSSEMGFLKRNIKNKGRGLSIRAIIDQIPNLLPRLCPCMLMSPISVAQFISLDNEKFDLVVFDEASQMPTSEAVGAIARGKALAVVGDPKQMPPTSFFTSSQTDDDDADIDDLESILDDCISLSMPAHYLTWHYRSKHESLIAFSNSQYYDGKLFTFPSVDDRSTKVTFVKIEGAYDRSRTRSNKKEAQAIVDEVVRRLSDPELRKRSIGIVSFSKAQQTVIEDLLYEKLDNDSDLKLAAEGGEEPIFIKNLENVQGDERDVILFSVGYGPDKDGHVSMNFGPLNNAGGERRLNVAVSRSRYEMMVFSSMTAGQIDLNRTNAAGVAGLKRFLEYAEHGTKMLAVSKQNDTRENSLVQLIAARLRHEGYEVDTFVGRSDFKVDIAVIDPADKQRYILGILCDGKNYYNTNTTRDREICQPNVLTMLNWNVMRVWAVDWYAHQDKVMERILDKLHNLKNPDKAQEEKPVIVKSSITFDLQTEKKQEAVNDRVAEYKKPSFPARLAAVVPADFYRKGEKVLNLIRQIVETEQPVTDHTIYRRMAEAIGQRSTAPSYQRVIDNLLTQNFICEPGLTDGIHVYWTSGQTKSSYAAYRPSTDRDIDDIPPVELRNAAIYVLEQTIVCPEADLVKQVSKTMGFATCGNRIAAAITTVVHDAVEEGLFTKDDAGNVKLA